MPMPPESITLELAKGAQVLSLRYVHMDKSLFLWAEVPTAVTAEKETREFRDFKTGDGIPKQNTYIATAIDQHQPETYHLYEVLQRNM